MTIEPKKSFCPYCSTKLQYCYINLNEKMLMCTKKKCLYPFDTDDVSPYIIKVDSLANSDDIAGSSSSSSLLSSSDNDMLKSTKSKNDTSSNSKSNLSNSESLSIEDDNSSLSPAKSNNIISPSTKQSSLIQESFNQLNKDTTTMTTNGMTANGTITLKTLGVTLKADSPNKNNKLQPNSPKSKDLIENNLNNNNNFSTSTSGFVDNLTTLFNNNSNSNLNDFSITAIEGSSSSSSSSSSAAAAVTAANIIDNTGNGLLNSNTTMDNILTVEEYSKMLFGQSDIDVNLDNLLSTNFNTMDVSTQGNDNDTNANANMNTNTNMNTNMNLDMDLDEFLGTLDSLETNKIISGNDGMNLDFDFLMASIDGSFAQAGISNDYISGNNLNVDLNSILINTNEVQNNDNNNEYLDIYNELVNGNNGISNDNMNMFVDLSSVNGQNGQNEQNGYHDENGVKNGVNGLEEDEGKNFIVGNKENRGKTTNGDSSVKLMDGKKGGGLHLLLEEEVVL